MSGEEGEADEGEADEGEADEGEADEGEAEEGEAEEGEAEEGKAEQGEAEVEESEQEEPDEGARHAPTIAELMKPILRAMTEGDSDNIHRVVILGPPPKDGKPIIYYEAIDARLSAHSSEFPYVVAEVPVAWTAELFAAMKNAAVTFDPTAYQNGYRTTLELIGLPQEVGHLTQKQVAKELRYEVSARRRAACTGMRRTAAMHWHSFVASRHTVMFGLFSPRHRLARQGAPSPAPCRTARQM